MSGEYREFLELVRELSTLERIADLLGWDEQTHMPPGSFRARARQNAAIAGIIHERTTSPRMGRLIRALKKQPLSADGQAILRETERRWRRASSIPGPLVREITRTSSFALDAWMRARKNSDFAEMEPWLAKMIGLKEQVAEHVGYDEKPYDALLDEFEPGMRSREVDALFRRLASKLVPVAARILEAPEPGDWVPAGTYPLDGQRQFITALCSSLGYDLNTGRIDASAHPFTTGNGQDVRITVRYDEHNPAYAVFPAIHETGHALYEQGYQEKYLGTPLAEAVSLGVHESQSRLWENVVGRGLPFWTFYYPLMQRAYPALRKVPLSRFYRGINTVRRSFIRVDADEVTYNLHIMLRYEAESAIFEGRLKASEIPAFWNERFERYLGIPVPDDANGCLQDIHWVSGAFGYFPTYTLGNLYAAQLWSAARRQVPDMDEKIAAGDCATLLAWLRKHVHRHGRRYPAAGLIKKATGETVNEDHFIGYIKEKYGGLYDVPLAKVAVSSR
jgi:carboxypeptidase Taq